MLKVVRLDNVFFQYINTRIDAIIETGTAGKEIMQLIARNIQTLDSVYPEIMKEIMG